MFDGFVCLQKCVTHFNNKNILLSMRKIGPAKVTVKCSYLMNLQFEHNVLKYRTDNINTLIENYHLSFTNCFRACINTTR